MKKYFAAIDIGSNAVRLLIKEQEEDLSVVKTLLLRVPLRLGEDVFVTGFISLQKQQNLVQLLRGYKEIMGIYPIENIRICATSAMRDATNAIEVCDFVRRETAIRIDIIDGNEEAKLLFHSHMKKFIDPHRNYLLVDVGGGSTEVSLIESGCFKTSRSFNLGTLRMLNHKVDASERNALFDYIESLSITYPGLSIIGSGGNINKLSKIAGLDHNGAVKVKRLKEVYKELVSLTLQQRIDQLKLRADRADVIVPAAEIFLNIAHSARISNIWVPAMGISDGMIALMCDETKTQM